MPPYNEIEDLNERLSRLRSREHALMRLIESPGWQDIAAHGEAAVTTRRQGIFAAATAIRSLEDVFSVARIGSEIGGIQFMLQLPHILLRDLRTDIMQVVHDLREETNGEQRNADAGTEYSGSRDSK